MTTAAFYINCSDKNLLALCKRFVIIGWHKNGAVFLHKITIGWHKNGAAFSSQRVNSNIMVIIPVQCTCIKLAACVVWKKNQIRASPQE